MTDGRGPTRRSAAHPRCRRDDRHRGPRRSGAQAYLLLRNAFTIALILAGADKFLNTMIGWMQYLGPALPRAVGLPPEVFLRGVGLVEIALGIWLALVPRRAASWVAGWLALIIVVLMMVGTHDDVALRDFALLLCALALARLAGGVHRWHEQHA